VLLANGRDLAVATRTGRHHVRIFWNPDTFRLGVALQAVALVAAIGLATAQVRDRARNGSKQPGEA
jgi:hypothetical protein